MRKYSLLLITFFFYAFLSAQNNFTKGEWTFRYMNPSVLKISFQPDGYDHNENITDAVVVKNKMVVITAKQKSSDAIETFPIGNVVATIHGDHITLQKGAFKLTFSYRSSATDKGFSFDLSSDEKIFGGGERALPLNRRGYRFDLYNNPWYGYGIGADNLNYSVPFITSSRHYALFFDNASRGWLDIGKTDQQQLQYGAVSGEINVYLITGNDYPDILKQYHSLTGTQPLPPRWALGSFMSRFGYTSEIQTRGIYKKMNDAGIPFDAVIFDLFWFGDSIKNTLGNLNWTNQTKWPDPPKMIRDFKKDGVQTILVTEPFVLENTKTYDAFKPMFSVDSAGEPFRLTNFYFGYGGLIDIFRPAARDLFWKYYKQQMDNGVEAWWGDLGEPEKHPAGLYHNLKSEGYTRLFAADEVHNVYGHNWTKMLYDKYAKEYPNKRLFSLNRSGFAGTQRFGIFPWTGDVSRSWEGLQAQMPIMLGMTMSGVPYVHADAGGFAGGQGDWELYIRWLQFAQFTPVFRPHGTALYEVDPGAFSFPSEIALADSAYLPYAKQTAIDRYRMLPYNYTLSYLQAKHAEPLASPVYYYYGNDSMSYKVDDEYMWGRKILVAPVYVKGAKQRGIYLPAGTWYQWNDNRKINGNSVFLKDNIDLSAIPVFVKGGSMIPLLPSSVRLRNTSEYSTSKIEWHYYADSVNSNAELFDDDGTSKNSIGTNAYELISTAVAVKGMNYRISFSSNKGKFKGKPEKRTFSLILHGIDAGSKISAGTKFTRHISANNELIVDFEFKGEPVVINISSKKNK